ncbi:hypothetical protein CHARACLAT_003140 [Characodon lateralis]|uniref:Uncharacterized protein n=1 Tax=Characodon lateralis TaxID=208331 RepID=A0ABU7EJT1_9TELE|nr:hypothetical protein [Characodon lateralis]
MACPNCFENVIANKDNWLPSSPFHWMLVGVTTAHWGYLPCKLWIRFQLPLTPNVSVPLGKALNHTLQDTFSYQCINMCVFDCYWNQPSVWNRSNACGFLCQLPILLS